MKRRSFIKSTAVIAAAAGSRDILRAAETLALPQEKEEHERLIVSAPVLQNYAETTIDIVFTVSALANGYVLIGEQPDLSDARKIVCGGMRLADIDNRVIQVRVSGLKPASRYYYRIGADRINYIHGHNMKITGNEEDPRVYSFVTAGEGCRDSRFCVINDTHHRWESMEHTLDKVAEIGPSCVIWNGDASNSTETLEDQIRIFLDHPLQRKDYASEIPYLLCPGNHDLRGFANRHLENVWMYRPMEERSVRDWDLGRNFAVRMGDIALIGLDTGEDKLDTNPIFAGLFKSGPYREAQREWLKDALQRPEIKEAPYIVAFCHIPIFDDDPSHNPGDIAPADYDPAYTTDYAYWQRTCYRLWGPLLEEAGCQLVVTAHIHRFRYYEPGPGHSWAQIVGGGPSMKDPDYPTVIEGWTECGELRIRVHNIFTGEVQGNYSFKPKTRV